MDLNRAASLAAKIKGIVLFVLSRHIQRGDVVKATLLSLLSGRPAFFLGTPGVDKTGTVQTLASVVDGAVYFEALMSTITSAEQLTVEATSIEEMPIAGGGKTIRVRETLGRAANAHIFFADEIWKGDSRVLQTLLDLWKGDGLRHEGRLIQTPLLAGLAASNELPEQDGNLGAMWSRMTIRVEVKCLDKGGKNALLGMRLDGAGVVAMPAKLTLPEVNELRAACKTVKVPRAIREAVFDIYSELLKKDATGFAWLWADDRRFGRVFDVLQAAALLEGRLEVTKADLRVLEWLLWDTLEQIAVVKAVLAPFIRTPAGEAKEALDALLAAGGTVETAFKGGDMSKATTALRQCKELKEQTLPMLRAQASGTEVFEIERLITALSLFIGKLAQKIGGVDVGTWEQAIKDLS